MQQNSQSPLQSPFDLVDFVFKSGALESTLQVSETLKPHRDKLGVNASTKEIFFITMGYRYVLSDL